MLNAGSRKRQHDPITLKIIPAKGTQRNQALNTQNASREQKLWNLGAISLVHPKNFFPSCSSSIRGLN